MKTKITAVTALRMAYLNKIPYTPDSNSRNASSGRSASYIRAAYKIPQRFGTDSSPAWV
jgi:hypothetical protein